MTDQNTKNFSILYSTPRAKTRAKELGVDLKTISGGGPGGLIIEKDILYTARHHSPLISPLAKKLSLLHNMDPQSISGSGFHNKVMAADIRNACTVSETPQSAALPAGTVSEDTKDHSLKGEIPFSGMRKIIADKMQDSLLTMAQASHRITVDMSEAIHLREQLKACDVKVSYNDIVIRCVAKALSEHPIMNSTMGDTSILLKKDINVGIAVATENGLLVPVIKHTDQKSLPEISSAGKDLAARTKSGTLLPDEMSEGTFTVTNLGMFGIESFTAIINKPEAGILAVGKMEKRPAVKDDQIVIRPLMQLSLTYDHRIVDGAPAAVFLSRIKQLLENPALLL